MKSTTLLLALLLSSQSWSQQTNENVDIGATNRTYVQYLPTGFNPATESLPVVFCLHGIGDVSTNMSGIGFNQIGDTARFISVYPQGLTNAFGQTSWNNGTLLSSTANDIDFFHAMINDMILNHNADPSRIYISGFSMGSIMSYKLACEMNNRIAAIGTMSGTMSTEDLTNCVPTYVTPVIHFHGTVDATVPFDSGALPSLELVPATINFWVNAHGCAATSDSTQIFDSAADGYTVDRFVYQNCTPLESVEFWRINGGDHEYFYQPNNDFTESIEIWKFFNKWTHSNPAQAGLETLTANGIAISPNPTDGVIEVTTKEIDVLEVYSTAGKLLHSQAVSAGTTTIDLSELSAGIYVVKLNSLPEISERIVVQ
ncbi:MAG: polyhydroxybutyrate depolymerase [Crocinitomicaceae bacterium]|jgi:polyhydroxybutyrate depolymerase